MSEIKTLDVDVDILGSLDVDVDFGKTIVKNIGGDLYSGPFEFYPSGEVQVVPIGGKTSTKDVIFKAVEGSLEITTNGTYSVIGKKSVAVDVNPDLRPLSVSENGTYQPDDFDGYSDVTVDVEPALESLTVTENGLYLPDTGVDGYGRVSVNVPPTVPVLQGKAVNPSETAQHVEPDSGYDGLSAVDVGAIPSSYVGSGVTRRSSSNLSASGNTVNVPSGYFAENASKAVQSGQAGTPVASKGTVSNHSLTVTPQVSNTEGYISTETKNGTPVTVTASELVSGSQTITENGSYDVTNLSGVDISIEPDLQTKSVNPSEESQTVTYDDDYDGLSSVSVGAIPSSYIGSAVNRRSSSDLTLSGATVNVPSGYFAENASKAVQSGQAGTPVASKGTASNHSIAVTPSVSNSEGYIPGGTLTGNAITVSASELVSGTKEVSITDNGTTIEDVTNYADAEITVNVANQDYEDALVALGVTEDLTDSIEALTTYANGVTGESDTTLSDAVESLADGYGGGGGSVSDGIEILGRDSTGFVTKARLHGNGPIYACQFACGNANGRNNNGPWQKIEEIEVAYKPTSINALAFVGLNTLTSFSCDMSEVQSINGNAFRGATGIGALSFPKVTSLSGSGIFQDSGITSASFPLFNGQIPNSMFRYCTSLASVSFPRATKLGTVTSNLFKDCTALITASFGSVGYNIINIRPDAFSGCTQSGLTITVYTTGTYVDDLLTNIRNGATNATIIFKASEATTYNGTSYSAGDTILTSTPS